MDAPPKKPPVAWQPLTLRGVAAFAYAAPRRLLLVQLLFACLAAVVLAWLLQQAWFSTIRSAIAHMPEQGQIRRGHLDWRGEPHVTLAEGRFLALVVDLDHQGNIRSSAHLQVEFGRTDFEVLSHLGLGYLEGRYPANWIVAFNRSELEPWWGAWAPAIPLIAAVLAVASLMLGWFLLALIYAVPAWLVGFFANRNLSWRGSWRLAGAALMPGALLLTSALFFYGLGVLDPLRLTVAAALHVVVGWGYVLVSPLFLPRHPALPAQAANPFKKPQQTEKTTKSTKPTN